MQKQVGGASLLASISAQGGASSWLNRYLPATSAVAHAPAAMTPTCTPAAAMAVSIPPPVGFLDVALPHPKRSQAVKSCTGRSSLGDAEADANCSRCTSQRE